MDRVQGRVQHRQIKSGRRARTRVPTATILAVMWKKTPSPADAGHPRGLAIDWQAALETNDRWLRTVVYTRCANRKPWRK